MKLAKISQGENFRLYCIYKLCISGNRYIYPVDYDVSGCGWFCGWVSAHGQSVVHTVGLERAGQSSSRLQSLVCVHDRLSNMPQSNSSPTWLHGNIIIMYKCTVRTYSISMVINSKKWLKKIRGSLGSVTYMTLDPYTSVGRVADQATLIISEGNTILGVTMELHLIDQRCLAGLKSTLHGEASATPFCQCLSRDFRYQALSSCK